MLVAGAGGMLGRDVVAAGERAGHELAAFTHGELDITDAASVARALERAGAELGGLDAAINCAAWTDVDGAESHPADAHAVNAEGAANLASAAAAAAIPLVHVSSDYVFAGEAPHDAQGAPRPYVESDATGPRSVYGQSKLAGERAVLGASSSHAVVRSAWLFGLHGANFAATMLRLAGEREAVQVVTDQVGCPTWTGHLAPALIGVLERGVAGLVHQAGGGQASWNTFAREIFRQAELGCRVEEATSAEVARPAPRPAWSVLASERADVLPLPDWRDGLAGYLAARAGMMRA
ncbi:MAG TPA: dTDP-4-dehydrorhamnose reductase [Solirubrobacteraceae bacterium]|nr:dTDP-4-dehydrorhamnose reductase [Solirubrobacteraceae bacterium]